MDIRKRLYFVATVALLLAPVPAPAQLNVLCPMAAKWCSLAATEFEKTTGIKASMTLKGSGESFVQVAAES
jgi:iron(III) transport system substrate-binding protein